MRLRLGPLDAIEILVDLIRRAEEDVIISVCIDADGSVGLSECFRWPRDGVEGMPLGSLFELPVEEGAAGVMFASRTHDPIERLHERDIEFTRLLVEHGRTVGIPVIEYVLIQEDRFRLMSESMSTTGLPA